MNKTLLKTAFMLFLAFTVLGNEVSAQETDSKATVQELETIPTISNEAALFPYIEQIRLFYGGYRTINFSGDESAAEYEYLHDSISLGGEYRSYPYPYRLHFDFDIKSKKDYFSDIYSSYKNIIYFRNTNRSVFHNLNNIRLVDLDTSTSTYLVDVRDTNKKHGITAGINKTFLRFKKPDFPFHLYIDATLIKKKGTQQQRSIIGGTVFPANNMTRSSQSRDIDSDTKNIIIGTNMHLGSVEVDISHGEKRFDVSGDSVMYDTYDNAGAGGSRRLAGSYPHNLTPNLESSTNTLKLHTSYTGKLVASATFTKIAKENLDSRAKADYFIGNGAVTWMPLTKLTFFMKYMHKDIDMDTPGTVSIANVCASSNNSGNDYTCTIKPSISSLTDTISGAVRYRLASSLTLRAKYSYTDIEREDYQQWGLPQSTQKKAVTLSADTRIARGLKLNTKYIRKDISNPAYNTEPDHSDEGKISVTWMPLPELQILLKYGITKDTRHNLYFTDTADAKNREAEKNRFLGSMTYLVQEDLSMTLSYSYSDNKTVQDIVYDDSAGNSQIDTSVPYKDSSSNYSIDLNYLPERNIALNTGISHTKGIGDFYPNDQNLLQPASVASFSNFKIKETSYFVSGEYKFKNGFAAQLKYRYFDFNDVLDSNDDIEDGKAQIIFMAISKKW